MHTKNSGMKMATRRRTVLVRAASSVKVTQQTHNKSQQIEPVQF